MRRFSPLLALVLLGAGCAAPPPVATLPSEPPPTNQPAAAQPLVNTPAANTPLVNMPAPVAPQPPRAETAAPAPFYVSYTAAQYQKALTDKRPVVLYFFAAWCPICRADEPIIKQRIENSGLPIAGFRVDFDTQSDLKQQFRIPYQHTTVMLDASGNESTRFTGPVDDATFMAALRTAAGAN